MVRDGVLIVAAPAKPMTPDAQDTTTPIELVIQRANGQLKQARDYWVLGRGAEPRAPRWSVLHDVLGWGRRPATASATPP